MVRSKTLPFQKNPRNHPGSDTQVLEAPEIGRRDAPECAEHLVALVEKKPGQVRTVLPRYSGYQSGFTALRLIDHLSAPPWLSRGC